MKRALIAAAMLLMSAGAFTQTPPPTPTTRTEFGDYVAGLPAATGLSAADQFYVRQGGVSKHVPWNILYPSTVPITGTPQVGWAPIATGPATAVWAPLNVRLRLLAPLTLYADFVNGADTATCGSGAGNAACKTVQQVYNLLVKNYDTEGQPVTISFNNNDPNGLNITQSWLGGGVLTIQGPGGSPPSIGFNTTGWAITVSAPLPANLNLVGFKITSANLGAVAIFTAGVVNIGENMNLGAVNSGSPHLQASGAGSGIQCNGVFGAGGYTVSGGGFAHFQAATGGVIACGNPVTVTGTPAFSEFASVAFNGTLLYTSTITGAATGLRYHAQGNGVIFTGAGACGATYFPGSTPGVLTTGGQCI
jgi:hypothetical protein